MKPENLNVNVPEGKERVEVVIREVDKIVEKELPVLEPLKVEIVGNITAPFAFLEKRWNAEDKQVDHSRTHLLVARDSMTILLVVNETDERNKKTIGGKVDLSRQYKDFGINSGKMWESVDLGNFFRINRSYFKNTEENMTLVSLLKRFVAKVNTDIERETKDNGSVTDLYSKVVDSNLPKAFEVCIPIYKGAPAETIKIEVVAHVEGRHAFLELISPDAQTIVEDVRDKLIDNEIEKIKAFAPEIPIIEV